MAFHDWNLDGKKDGQDDFFEYQIVRNFTEQKNNSSYIPRNKVSNGRAIFCAIGGLILATLIVALFTGGKPENVPEIVTLVLWIICCSILAVFSDNHRK